MSRSCCLFFFFNDPATTEIYTLSLHDALPIFIGTAGVSAVAALGGTVVRAPRAVASGAPSGPPTTTLPLPTTTKPERSEEHTSELQSQSNLVCRLLLENKKT